MSRSDARLARIGLRSRLHFNEQQGGFQFAGDTSQTTDAYPNWTPVLSKPGSWSAGDFVYAATVVRPTGTKGQVEVRALPHGAAALMLEPDGLSGFLWVVNLTRHQRRYEWEVPDVLTVEAYKWSNCRLPPIPAGEPAYAGLIGGESVVWHLKSVKPIDPAAIVKTIRLMEKKR